MNPVAHFEQSAKKIWISRLGPEEKSQQLTELAEKISGYVAKFEDLPALNSKQDEWAKATVERARKYLENLATDVVHLAAQCRVPS